MKRREDLSTPRRPTRKFAIYYDPENFGNFSETIARFLGTARYLVWQSAFIVAWVIWNTLLPKGWRAEEFPFQFLTLLLSLQASYAAPLILLAQNRQESRESTQSQSDREVNERTKADTEFLARELVSVRLMLGDLVTSADVGELTRAIDGLTDRIAALEHGSGHPE